MSFLDKIRLQKVDVVSLSKINLFKKAVLYIWEGNFDFAYRLICKWKLAHPHEQNGLNCSWDKRYINGISRQHLYASKEAMQNSSEKIYTAIAIFALYSGDTYKSVSKMFIDLNCDIFSEETPIYFNNKASSFSENTLLDTLSNFENIHYRALNKLKKSKVGAGFQGQISTLIDYEKFCSYCFQEGLIRYSTPAEDQDLFTISEYKFFLQNMGLKISGNKKELAQRILEASPSFFGQKHIMLTDTGNRVLGEHWNSQSIHNQVLGEKFRELENELHYQGSLLSANMNFISYKESGIKKYQYLATLDSNTCPHCGSLDRKIFLVSEKKIGINCPPMHRGCRCTTISVSDKSQSGNAKRSAIIPSTGQAISVSGDMNYSQWHEKYGQ